MTAADLARPATLSRESSGVRYRWTVRAKHLNAWCRIPGNPFISPLVLMANPPGFGDVRVEFGPVTLPDGFDTFTVFLRSAGRPPHAHLLRTTVEVLDGSGEGLAGSTHDLASGKAATTSLRFAAPADGGVSLALSLAFDQFAGGDVYGSVRLAYLLAYEHNELIEICNAGGSDKGTETSFGRGVPHCYAVDYHRLFAPFRGDEFRMLEIGLENASSATRQPTDAPSLRIWREFFPRATIYGYDINDFSFFEQDRTITFQGDQASRADLERFIAEQDEPELRLVIDDGSHASSHQQVSLASLFPHVEPGGLYVIEDLHWQPFEESPTTLEVLRHFQERAEIRSPFIGEEEARDLERSIEAVEILRPNDSEFGVIRKKG
jgi:hypothetical protein